MPIYESHAIILKSFKLNEADRIVTFFTSRYGKIKAIAKGAIKPKGRYLGRLELFVHCNMIAFGKERMNLLRLNSCDIVNSFLPIREGFDALSHAFVAVELVNTVQKECDENREAYQLLLDALIAISAETDRNKLETLLRIFELKYISCMGYKPNLHSCVSCTGGLETGRLGFNAERGGVVCNSCNKSDPVSFLVSPGTVRLMERALSTPMDKASKLVAGGKVLSDLRKCVNKLIEMHVQYSMRSEFMLDLAKA